ncbi:LLM class flavin-dependent oxidoreductase [Nonomuraea rubra]|uniref:LLM class flavin-dependent oxidoreductase n=1 Tax=Nonomuraea rubra TaxID=46180 RepID=UPI0036180E4E
MTIPFYDRSLARSQDLIAELPGLGYTDLWSAEVNGVDGFVPLALASQWAPEARLGSAIVPVSTRGPGLLAMSAATLADLAPGRFVLGIGASSPAIVERWNAGTFDKPYARTRDTLRFLKRALAGRRSRRRTRRSRSRASSWSGHRRRRRRSCWRRCAPDVAPGRGRGRRGHHELALA